MEKSDGSISVIDKVVSYRRNKLHDLLHETFHAPYKEAGPYKL